MSTTSSTEKVVLQLGSTSGVPTLGISAQVTFSLDSETDEWAVSGDGFEYVSAANASKTAALIGWLSKILGVT